ncbi:Gcd10p [Sugiyamaella lignohabitans]|uniref:tRNA (adenine(58)-N(1))-methyltransferase non-catalytic subunit TRM6 n=1 Tax=Sugiyamaella lignohabitans TaxID=796027 RepID=A0A167E8Q1_9ASCO|nr:Gcd10p [Sugiyamaella lignohabitans]ANB13779.1 Gcd10p [Sugiyamaella lignohabitans]
MTSTRQQKQLQSLQQQDPESIDYSHEFDQTHIKPGQYVMIRLPSENFRVLQLHPGQTVNLGKFGSFKVDDILNHPYGYTYEIGADNKLSIVNHNYELDNQDEPVSELAPHENNRELVDDSSVQGLSMAEIEELKKGGLSGKQIIEKVKTSHSSFDKKTAFSKEKYLKRKQQKFLNQFTPEPIGSAELIDIYLDKDASRIQNMSEESLALMLSLANVRPGGTYLVVDDISGLLVGAMMERMGGEGLIVVAHDNEHPNLDGLRYMNYSQGLIAKMIKTVNWLEFFEPSEIEPFEEKTTEELQQLKSNQRGQYYRRRTRYNDSVTVQNLISNSGFDGLLVATGLHLASLIPRIIPAVGGSRPIVMFSETKELLTETTLVLHKDFRVISPTILETRLRKYQTLPGRMHPHMTSRGGGGYVLWGIRVFPDENANAVGKVHRKRKATDSGTSTPAEE